MKALKMFILLVFLSASCSNNNEYLRTLSKEGLNHHLLLGLIVHDNSTKYITIVDNTELYHSIYIPKFNGSFTSYSKFLEEVLEGKIDLYYIIQEIDNELHVYDSKLITDSDLEMVKMRFFDQKGKYLVFKIDTDMNLKYHLIEYLTSKRFFIIFDDHSGEFMFFSSLIIE